MGKPKAKLAKQKRVKAKSGSAPQKTGHVVKVKKGFVKKKHKWGKAKIKPQSGASNDNVTTSESSMSKVSQGFPIKSLKKLTKTAGAGLSLREKMMKQLNAARFRQINETLDSGNADPRKAFGDDQVVYAKYHETYNELKLSWDANPINEVISKIETISQTHGAVEVVDFGCGDGSLMNHFEKTSVTVRGVDLYKVHPKTIVCDMTSVPFKNSTADVTVFCLSLMAKDVGKFIVEANRILKLKGTLIIAEVESRFIGGAKKFTLNMKSYGFVTIQKDSQGKQKQDKFNAHLAHKRLGDMFVIMEFTKVKNILHMKANLPSLSMKPCVYKKR